MRVDPGRLQVLFADAQTSLVADSGTGTPAAVQQASAVLAQCAALLSIPMTFSVVAEQDGAVHLLESLAPYAHDGNCFRRDAASPFMDNAVREALEQTDRRTVVVAGFACEVVVAHAAFDAIAAGYEVILPIDAIGSLSLRTEQALLAELRRAGARTTSVATFVTSLAPDFSADPGKSVIALVRELGSPPRKEIPHDL